MENDNIKNVRNGNRVKKYEMMETEKRQTVPEFSPTKSGGVWGVNEHGYYGNFGGAFIPEMLYPNVKELQENYLEIPAHIK